MSANYASWKAFLEVLPQFREEGQYSKLWTNFIQEFRSTSGGIEEMDAFIQKNCRGYCIRNKARKFTGLFTASELSYGYLIRRLNTFGRYLSVHAKGKRARSVFDYRTYILHDYLKRLNVKVEEYLNPISNIRPVRISYNTLKTIYYVHKLITTCPFDATGKKVVVEVGAGAANFPIILTSILGSLNYFVIDLPEMLAVSAYEVMKYMPDVRIVMPCDVAKDLFTKELSGGKKFYFLTPSQTHLIPDQSTDLAVNIESFAEMPQFVAEEYVRTFYRVLKPGGVMFTANRESRITSENGQFTCYWKLPYSSQDDVLLWEYCPMRQCLMDGAFPNINRIARV